RSGRRGWRRPVVVRKNVIDRVCADEYVPRDVRERHAVGAFAQGIALNDLPGPREDADAIIQIPGDHVAGPRHSAADQIRPGSRKRDSLLAISDGALPRDVGPDV